MSLFTQKFVSMLQTPSICKYKLYIAMCLYSYVSIFFCSDKLDSDKHPEKRLKAAFTAFEEVNLPRLKAENPTLRLSQLKQMLRKEWTKSPQNPINQKI